MPSLHPDTQAPKISSVELEPMKQFSDNSPFSGVDPSTQKPEHFSSADAEEAAHLSENLRNIDSEPTATKDAASQTRARHFLHLIRNDEELNSWTNIASFKLLDTIVKAIHIAMPDGIKNIDMSLEEAVALVFVKLKMNLPFTNMASLFLKSRNTVSNYFYYLLPILKVALSPLVY